MLRFAFDPQETGPLLPGVGNQHEDFYDGIQPYIFAEFTSAAPDASSWSAICEPIRLAPPVMR